MYDPDGKQIMKKGIKVVANRNNEEEYATLKVGLQIFLKHGIQRLQIKGDTLFIVKKCLELGKVRNLTSRSYAQELKVC